MPCSSRPVAAFCAATDVRPSRSHGTGPPLPLVAQSFALVAKFCDFLRVPHPERILRRVGILPSTLVLSRLCLCPARDRDLAPPQPEILEPQDCRSNPEHRYLANVVGQPGCTREEIMQGIAQGEQRKKDRKYQQARAPRQTREIVEPEECPDAPVKRRVPRSVTRHHPGYVPILENECQRRERGEHRRSEQPLASL